MSKATKAIIAIIFVIVVAGAAIWALSREDKKDADTSTPNTSQNTNQQAETPNQTNEESPASVASTITYTNDGFQVSNDTIKAGDTVKVVNNSDQTLDFSSDPHPVHTDNSELNAGDIAPGESKTFMIEKKGKWGFHNHLQSSHHGEITVE